MRTNDRIVRLANRIAVWLSGHRLLAFLITSGVAVLLADAVREVLPEESEVDVLTWIVVAAMALDVVATIFIFTSRSVPADRRILTAWGLALAPTLYGIAAAQFGSPEGVMWLGVAVTIALVGLIAATARPVDA